MLTVHPHGRGDNRRPACSVRPARGSPPRAWGQSGTPATVSSPYRFTPTGVGTIPDKPRPATDGAVHPHGRGDNEYAAALHGVHHGSPPRAWGQFAGDVDGCGFCRFTPTGVGTIRAGVCVRRALPVHPHGRGDNSVRCQACQSRNGSPPRAWGQWGGDRNDQSRLRFTPTGVGTIMLRRGCCC